MKIELCKLKSIFINIMTHYVWTITTNNYKHGDNSKPQMSSVACILYMYSVTVLFKSTLSLALKKRINILFLFTYTSFQNVHVLTYILLIYRMHEKCTAIPTDWEPKTQYKKNSSVNMGLLKGGFWVMSSWRLKKMTRSVHLKSQCRRLHVWTVTACVLKNSRCHRNHLQSTLLHCCKS